MHGLGKAAQQVLGLLDEHFVVGVGLIELQHGELGVVALRDPLVAKVAVDLVDPLQAADDETLEVELRCDAEEEVDVESVVVRDEWTRRGAAGDGLHHRRLHFDEAMAVEPVADVLHDLGPRHERLLHVIVDDEIDVALPVALLHVGESVPLGWQRAECLDEKVKASRFD